MNEPPASLLDETTVADFQWDGAVCLRGLFDPAWLSLLAEGVARNMAHPGPGSEFLTAGGETGRFFNDYCNWRRIPEFREFVLGSPSAQVAAELMLSRRAVFYHEHVLVKEPGSRKRTPWHHDQPYYPIDGRQNCSLWLPLDPVPEECSLRFARGSHHWGKWFVPRKFRDSRSYAARPGAAADRAYEELPDLDGRPEEYEILTWALEPGDCLAFHMLTLHSAAGNSSLTTPRRVFGTRWLGDDARFAGRPWEVSPPITGGLRVGDPIAGGEFPVVWPPAG